MNTRKQTPDLRQGGFTLIELVMVIVILGVLAAMAVPRFVDLGGDARAATVRAVAGSLRSASMMAHAMMQAQSIPASGGFTISGDVRITLKNGYPDAASISKMLADTSGFTVDSAANPTTFTAAGAVDGANCKASYGEALANKEPTISVTTSGC